jgi:ribosomal protein L29
MVVSMVAFGAGLYAVGKAVAFTGVILGAVMKFSAFATIAMVVGPIILKLASFLPLVAIGFGALKLALGMALPPLLAVTAVVATLAAGVVTLGAVWLNAQAQGISFGESVLDLANRLTGLSNAYSRLRDSQNLNKDANQIVRRGEAAVKTNDVQELDKSLKDLRAKREDAKAALDRARAAAAAGQVTSKESTIARVAGLVAPGGAGPSAIYMTHREEQAQNLRDTVRGAELDLAIIERQIQNLSAQRPLMIATRW